MKKVVLLLVAVALFSGCGMEQVDEGFRGIKTNWGKVIGDPLSPGLQFYNPISSDVFELDVRERKMEGTTEAFTKDTQKVDVTYVVTYYPEATKIGALYSQLGRDWDAKIIQQAVLGSMKDTIGQYIADDLVGKREIAKKAAEAELKQAFAERHVVLTRLDFVNLNFDDAYERAVEAKVVAVQQAAEAKNKTVRVREEAEQTIVSARADAESMKIKSQALSQNKSLIGYEWVQKWNGVLPTTVFGDKAVPMINLSDMSK